MENSTLPFPFAKAMDVTNQVLFLIILASFSNGKLENADLQKLASQLKVTHYDCGEMTEKNLYALNQVSKCNIAPENIEVKRAKITMYTKHLRQEINATVCRVKHQSEQGHCGFRRPFKHGRPSHRSKNNRLIRYSISMQKPSKRRFD